MRRTKMTHGPIIVWTSRSTSIKHFHPMTTKRTSVDIAKMLISFDLTESTGDLTVRPAIRYSDDGDTWGSAADIGTETLTNIGSLDSTTWNTLPGTPKTYCQIGFHAYNTTNPNLEMGRVSARIDVRSFT